MLQTTDEIGCVGDTVADGPQSVQGGQVSWRTSWRHDRRPQRRQPKGRGIQLSVPRHGSDTAFQQTSGDARKEGGKWQTTTVRHT